MPLLRLRNASFVRGATAVGPVSLDVAPGEHAALACGTSRDAAVIALLAAGIAKTSSGCVLIGDYDPKVQSVHCKRIAAFVPHEAVEFAESDFRPYVAYRAALWNVDGRRALAHARLLRERLDGMHEAFAYPLIGALIGMPELIVFDRPQTAYVAQIVDIVGPLAMFSTHAGAVAARAFAARCERRVIQA
jgi:hypothetical protein